MKIDSLKSKKQGDVYVDVDPEAAPEASAATGDAIDRRRAELDLAVIAAAQIHDEAAAATDVETAALQRIQRAIAGLSVELAAVSRRHLATQAAAVEETLAGLDENGEVVISCLLEADELARRHRLVADLSGLLVETRQPLAEERVLGAEIEERIARAGRISSVADRRQIDLELSLALIAADEGDAVLDQSKTYTGIMRAEADELLVSVVGLREQLLTRQRARVAAARSAVSLA